MQPIIDPGPTPVTFDVPGWQRPDWATDAKLSDGDLTFTRDASVIPVVLSGQELMPSPSPVQLFRTDELHIDAEAGTMSIEQGPVVIYVNIEEVSPSEARKLAAALVELADYADGAR
jgi:hypothetical protein